MNTPKTITLMLLAATLFACGGNKTTAPKADTDTTVSIVGSWTMANPDDSAGVIGVKLSDGGKAESINMPTLPYSSWQQMGDTVVLTGQSIIDDEAEPVSDTCIVSGNKMSISGTDIVYTRK